jgi:CHAT domain-containing protein
MKKIVLFVITLAISVTLCKSQLTSKIEVKEMYFRIVELEIINKDSTRALLNVGLQHNIKKGLTGPVKGAYIKGQTRFDIELGFASVTALNDTQTLVLIRPNEKHLGKKELTIQMGDLVVLKTEIPLLNYRSVFFELGCLNIFFNDAYGKPLHNFNHLIFNDSKLLEDELLNKAAKDVVSIYNYYKDETDTAFNVFKQKLTLGRYSGKSIFDVMSVASERDIYSFLNYVKTYPKSYLGKDWKIGETFATWVMNGAYYSKSEMKDSVLLYSNNTTLLKKFFTTHKTTFLNEDFIQTWLTDATDEPDSVFDRTIKAAKIALTYLPSDNEWGTFYYALSDRFIDKSAYQKALVNCDSSIHYFTKAKNNNAVTVLLFRIARCYYNLENYNACLASLKKGLLFINDTTNNVRESTKITNQAYYYKLTALCYYNIQEYKLAVENFITCIKQYKAYGSFEYIKEAIRMQDFLAKIYVKQSETIKALEIYNEQLTLYLKLNDKQNVAATLDKIAGADYKLGNYRSAINNYTKAKAIHIDFNDLNSAGYSQSHIGSAYWNLGKYDSSIASHEQAIKYRQATKSHSGLGYSWKQLGELFKKTGEKPRALAAYDTSAYYYNLAKDSSNLKSLLNDVGDVFYEDKLYQKAFDYYYKYYSISVSTNTKPDIVYGATQLAAAAYYFSLDSTKKYALIGLNISKQIGDKDNEYNSYLNLASVAFKEYNYVEGEKYFTEALLIAQTQKNKKQEASCYMTLSSSMANRLEFDKSVNYTKKAISIYDSLGDKSRIPEAYRLIANAVQAKGDFYEARKNYERSIDIATSINSKADVGYAYNSLVFLYVIQGELSKAEKAADTCLTIFSNLSNTNQMANAYLAKGIVSEAKSDGITAIKYYNLADSIFTKEKDNFGLSSCQTSIACVFYYQADFDNALKHFIQADKYLSDIKFISENHLLAPINIGETYYYKNDYVKAEKFLLEGYTKALEKKSGRYINMAALYLGKLYIEKQKYSDAEKYLLESYKNNLLSNETDLVIQGAMYLGRLYNLTNNNSKAEKYYKEAVDYTKTINNSKYTWRALYEYGLNFYNNQKFDSAVVYFKQAVEIVEASSQKLFGGAEAKKIYNADSRKVDLYNKLVASLAKTNNKEDALYYADKSNNQAIKEQSEKAGFATTDKAKEEAIKKGGELLQKQNAVDQAIAKEKTKPEAEQNKQLIASLESIQKVAQKDYINYINGLVKKYPDMQAYFSKTNPADFKNSMRFIPDSTLAVLYIINDNQLFIFTATKQEIGIKTIELKQDINKQAERLLGILKNPLNVTGTGAIRLRSTIKSKDGIKGDFKTEASILYDMLITPIKDQIKDKKNICIIPNGKLSNIPFQSLGTNDAQGKFHFLVEDYAIFYTNKMDIFSKPHEVSNINKSFIALGNPDKSLPNASEEVKNFSGIVKNAAIYTEGEATETKATEGLSNYQYVHFATHGILDYADFEKSYLVFAPEKNVSSDGKLTIEKINGLTISNCSLVTLSACETAVSKEAVKGWYISPANSFLQNNVSSVVASLWQVDDKATSVLMTEFYKNLSTMSKVEALRKAQETLSKNPDYSHPYFWSAFVLYGEWR